MTRKKRKRRIVKRRKDEIGVFGIETPASIKRKVLDLLNSWQRLAKSYPNNKLIRDELAAYKAWADDVNASVLNRLFASSIAPKYDSWLVRYKDAFEKAKAADPNVSPIAPEPGTLTAPVASARTSPWVWAVLAGSVAIGLYSVYKIRETS